MVCDLSDEALFILNYLYCNRNLGQSRGQNSKKIAKDFKKQFNCRNNRLFDDTIRLLQNAGYITAINKKIIKYYISDRKMAFTALDDHGYNVSSGKERPL